MIIALSFSIAMVLIFDSIAYGVTTSSELGDVGVAERVTKIYCGDQPEEYKAAIEKLAASQSTERLIKARIQDMNFQHFFGTANVQTFFVSEAELPLLLEYMDVKLLEGRMPQTEKEVVLTSYLAANKGKKVGDLIGKTVDATEKLPGEYSVVGILSGECIAGFGIDIKNDDLFSRYLALPKQNQLGAMNQVIREFSQDELYYWDLGKATESDENNKNRLNGIFDTIALAILIMMSFGIGNASYAHYFSRRYEFGILQSVGYTKNAMLLRIAREVLGICLLSLVFGTLLGLGINLALKINMFDVRGYPFSLVQARGFLRTVAIPVSTAVFTIFPSAWLLSNVDPMIVVEKNEG
jgi:putative ABC transport system permease protein